MNLTLFHYPFSPYAEKIRCMLGYCGIEWNSFEVPPYPPRPTLDDLSGGYGRIPVAQIGADIFCDSQLIVEEIVAISGDDSLDFQNNEESLQGLVKQAQGTIFMDVVASASPLKMLARMVLGFGPRKTLRFIKDRTRMAANSPLKLNNRKEAQQQLDDFLNLLESGLESTFLGGEYPCGADFCVYHPLWMLRTGVDPRPPKKYPKVMSWMDRMSALSGKPQSVLSEAEVFEMAESQPRVLPTSTHNENLGKRVKVGPVDYRLETVEGELVAETEQRWILKRVNKELGDMHIHFPKQGYQLTVC